MHVGKGKTIAQSLGDRLDYGKNPDKTEAGELISSYECAPETADAEFLLSKQRYKILTGRTQSNDVIAYQIRQSFKPGEITPEDANRIGYEFAMRFTKGRHAFIVCTHTDKKHIHNHIYWNSTTLDCMGKFRDFRRSGRAVRELSDLICIEHRLSVIEKPQRHGKSYNKWLGSQAKPSHREEVRILIDEALSKNPRSMEELLGLLSASGYEVKRGKNITLVKPGQKNIRLNSLGDGYTENELFAVIAGVKSHTPRKNRRMIPPKAKLITEIEAKLNGRHSQWDSVRLLKQMAQSVLYVQQHDFDNFDALAEKSAAATARVNELSTTIKNAETRMTEIAALKTQIINYAKTRDVYAGYRKAGYSKKYFAEHEDDIIIHKAAKKAFDEMNLKKLPTVKSLNAEYSELLTAKKSAYAEYTETKKEMRELLVHKANVEYILGLKEQEKTKIRAQEREEK
jgi:hypothetical protein